MGLNWLIKIIVVRGKIIIFCVVNVLWNIFYLEFKVLIVIDGDDDFVRIKEML